MLAPPLGGASPFMSARQLALLTPPRSSHPRPLVSSQQSAPLSPLSATLMDLPASVANKRLTQSLSPLDSALTKNRGGRGVMGNQSGAADFNRTRGWAPVSLTLLYGVWSRVSGQFNWLSIIPSARIASLHHPARLHAPKRG